MATIKFKNENGDWISIPAIKGEDGDTPFINELGNWQIGDTDTGIKAQGNDGESGQDGTSITVSNVSESTEDGGNNVITFSDGKTITIKNGGKGNDGQNGSDGYTPVKGVDYFTEADKTLFISEVIDSIGCPVFGVVDENNDIVLTGTLPSGTYTLKYENEDGTVSEIGSLAIAEELVNLVPISIDTDGNVYNGTGYKEGYRFNSSGSEVEESTTAITGYIELKDGKKLTLQSGNGWDSSNSSKCYIVFYNSAFNKIYYISETNLRNYADTNVGIEFPSTGGVSITSNAVTINGTTYSNIKYVRFSASLPADTITVYEENV